MESICSRCTYKHVLFLYNCKNKVVVNQMDGGLALVVQAFTFGKYLGYLNVTFDVAGKVIDYGGNPILLDASVEQGTANQKKILPNEHSIFKVL
ncbi:V5NTD-like protein [Mya arenaria]|uniref:V5NTD-like protein n=1 Tax=Mya arenaria TaxID=6604 RepID=A0ABY7ED83_MYAAR|nr:V5NTD-like protein [Mya arenaria]